jgi:hypothetical protein
MAPAQVPQRFVRLVLYRKAPARGHGVTGRTFGLEGNCPQRLRLVIEPKIEGSNLDGDEQTASIRVANPLPYTADADVSYLLADYFGAPVEQKTETVHIEPHKVWTGSIKFTARGAQRAYQLDVKTRPEAGFKFPFPRPVDWLEFNEYTRVEFLPNLSDPLTAWNHFRIDLASDKSSDRKAILLDGDKWQAAPLKLRRVPKTLPADLVFAPCRVPDGVNDLPKGQFGWWYRTKFRLPDWMPAKDVFLTLRAGSEATVFLNGKRIDCCIGRIIGNRDVGVIEVPQADLAGALKAEGENELVLCLRDAISLVNDAFVDQYGPSADDTPIQDNLDRYGTFYHAVGVEKVTLRTAPAMRVKESLIIPDVEKKQLRVFTRLRNEDSRPHKVMLAFQVEQLGKPVKAPIPEQTVTVEAGSVKDVPLDGEAGELAEYTFAKPVLARLTTTLSEDGKPIDRLDQRFGYRSVRVQGTGILLNAQQWKPYGASFHRSEMTLEGMDCARVMRATYDRPSRSEERDYFDEIGIFQYPAMEVIWNTAAWKLLNNEKYWADAKQAVIDKIWECGSHPCVIGWELSNESYHYAPYETGKEAQDKLGRRIDEVVHALRAATWLGWWCIADGDENCGDRLDFCSFHYLNHTRRACDFGQGRGCICPEPDQGVSFFPPDGHYLNGAGQAPVKGTKLHQNPDWVFGSTACGDTECYDTVGDPIGTVKDLGDCGIVSAAYQNSDAAALNWERFSIQAYRDMEGFTGGTYWRPMLGVVAQDVDLVMPEQEVRYYSGALFSKRINVHDDQYLPGRLDVQWQLLDPKGNVVSGKQFSEKTGTTFLGRYRIEFDLPTATERTVYTLDMRLRKDGKLWSHEQRRVEVWPAIPRAVPGPLSDALQIVLFDPNGKVAPILQQLGQNAKKIDAIDAASLAGAKTLIVGPDCVKPDMATARDALTEFASAGGRVLVLHQDDATLLPGNLNIQKPAWFSQCFVRASNHPVMKGLADLDFQMWQPDHLICRGAFMKPDKGNILTLVDSAHNHRDGHNVSWSEALEIYLGKGSILAVQLPLVEQFSREPMAAEMFKRMLEYLAGPVYRKTNGSLAVLAPVSEPVATRLNEVRAQVDFVGKLDASRPLTLIDLGASAGAIDTAAIKSYVDDGGTLILHRARPEHSAALEALLGKKVRIDLQPYLTWDDRQIIDRRGGLLEGLGNMDLYWRTEVPGEGLDSHWQVSMGPAKGTERNGTIYVVNVDGVDDYLFPGGLVEVKVGKGRVIVDQLKWELSAENMLCGSPTRAISTLLTNLGVLQRLPLPKPTLPPGVTYETIDLAKFVNRAFKDPKAGSNTGWLDWGPDQDLSEFPTGDIYSSGVPFHVTGGDKNCIVLRAKSYWIHCLGDYPRSVTIPVGKKNVAGMWFLFTGGWTGGAAPYLWREIRYTDGSQEVIALNDTNCADWNFGHEDFPKEEYTTTTVAWKGACKSVPVTRVYKTLWVNPHPEKEIKEVVLTERDLKDDQCRFVAHLGMTAAILPPVKQPSTAQAGRDEAKSRQLLQEALKLLADGKTADAAARLQAAVQADDQNNAAWKEWTDLAARSPKPNEALAVANKWVAAMPNSYPARNGLGDLLEKQGKLKEALAQYDKSLQIEWNQPPILQAKIRVEKALQNNK